MRRSRIAVTACAAASALLIAQSVFAGVKEVFYDAGGSTGIILTTPDTYHACPRSVMSDTISTTGVGNRQLVGQVIVQYVLDGTRQVVPGGFYPIDQTGDLNLAVSYPPVSDWPVQSGGGKELHIDVQVELFEGGLKVATLGPGSDWDVFCVDPGPTPTPTSTPTPTPTPPSGGQGCTPGYWRQTQHFDSYPAPYSPQTLFSSVFGVGPSITLAEAADAKGGGANALIRHATAALLNAASANVNYAYTTDQVIAMVKDAYATGNYEATKNLFEAQNEINCPLN